MPHALNQRYCLKSALMGSAAIFALVAVFGFGIVGWDKSLLLNMPIAIKREIIRTPVIVSIRNEPLASGKRALRLKLFVSTFSGTKLSPELLRIGNWENEFVCIPTVYRALAPLLLTNIFANHVWLDTVQMRGSLARFNMRRCSTAVVYVNLNFPGSMSALVKLGHSWGFKQDSANPELWTKLRNESLAGDFRLLGGFMNSPLRSTSGPSRLPRLFRDSKKREDNRPCCRSVGPSEEAETTWRVPFGIGYVLLGLIFVCFNRGSKLVVVAGVSCGILGGMFILNGYVDCHPEKETEQYQILSHNGGKVSHPDMLCVLGRWPAHQIPSTYE